MVEPSASPLIKGKATSDANTQHELESDPDGLFRIAVAHHLEVLDLNMICPEQRLLPHR